MGESFFDSKICQSRKRCWQCRVNRSYRKGIAASYDVPDVDFDCPFGITEDSVPESDRGASLLDKAKSLSSAVADSASRLVHGEQVIQPKSEAERRLDTCKKCRYFDQKPQVCKICTCHMTLKVKRAGAVCPIGEW